MTCKSLPLFGIDTISSSDILHLSWMGSMGAESVAMEGQLELTDSLEQTS